MKVNLPPISQNKFPIPSPSKSLPVSPKWQYTIGAYTNLDRSIRTNNVTQFLGDTRVRPAEENRANDIADEEKREMIQNLTTVRKRFNEIREECEKKSVETDKMKRDLDKMKSDEDYSTETIDGSQRKLQQLKEALTFQKTKIEEIALAQQTYLLMLDRLKKDKMADQMKINKFESQYNIKIHDLLHKQQEVKNDIEFSGKIKSFAQEAKKQCTEESYKRLANLHNLENTLTAREEYEIEKEKRTEHIQNIADNAAAEVDFDQKQYNELLLTHKFLKFFLKNKIDRQVRRYESSEKAFQKIKASTGLTDLNEIISKFLGREEKYSELLISIADSERKNGEARKHNEQLAKKVKELREENNLLDKMNEERRDVKGQNVEVRRELNAKIAAHKQSSLILERTHHWGVRALTLVDKAQQIKRDNYEELYPEEKMTDAFTDLITKLKENLEKLKEKDIESPREKVIVDVSTMDKEFIAKNIRVRPQDLHVLPETYKSEGSKAEIDGDEQLGMDNNTEEPQQHTIVIGEKPRRSYI